MTSETARDIWRIQARPVPKRSGKHLQGDHSGCVMGCVDIKTKVVFQTFQYMDFTLKRNLCFDVNTTHDTT